MKRIYPYIFVAFLLIIAVSVCFYFNPGRIYSRVDLLMDTFLEIKVSDPEVSRHDLEIILNKTITLGKKLENKFDMFNPASEVNELNISGNHKCSVELFGLLQRSLEISALTGGKFDITISPILNTKGFYSQMPEGLRSRIPDSFDGVGWKNVRLYPESGEAELLNKAWIDLSGIAKGYIVSKMSEYLKDRGIKYFLINAGGDIYCTAKSRGRFWKIGVREPGTDNMVFALKIKDRALATSGDYENIIKNTGGAGFISHIIDPSKNEPLPEKARSVTVIASDAATADALATGMMTMDREVAVELADSLDDVEIIVIERTADVNLPLLSSGASKYLIDGEI